MSYEPRYEIDLIPKRIEQAKEVNPDTSVALDWQRAIYRDLENPSPTFSWFNWLKGNLP